MLSEALAQEPSLHTPEILGQLADLMKRVPQADWTPLLVAQLTRAREAIAQAEADRDAGPPEP
jgi:hypothetical protein